MTTAAVVARAPPSTAKLRSAEPCLRANSLTMASSGATSSGGCNDYVVRATPAVNASQRKNQRNLTYAPSSANSRRSRMMVSKAALMDAALASATSMNSEGRPRARARSGWDTTRAPFQAVRTASSGAS